MCGLQKTGRREADQILLKGLGKKKRFGGPALLLESLNRSDEPSPLAEKRPTKNYGEVLAKEGAFRGATRGGLIT